MTLLSAALAALTGLSTSCAESVSDGQERTEDGRTAVTFGAQTRRSTTRAGVGGDITTSSLKDVGGAHQASGFGVFAYYSDNGLYDGTGIPDFMYNQQVTYNAEGAKWTYTPVMYWPNEHGAAAESEALDRLSFFAYAPWVDVTPATGIVTGDATKGIVGMTRNSAAGDPRLRYVTSWKPAEGVDLLWGTDESDGLPYLDLTKQNVDDKITFTMRHALAKLNLQVDVDVDDVGHNHTNAVDGNTRVWVRSVTLSGVAPQGELSLNNAVANAPQWTAYGGGSFATTPITIHDGRYDGQEALYAATGEPLTGLNPVVVQSTRYSDDALTDGVTKTAANLLNGATLTDAVYVIPTGGPMNVTITYDVETQNPDLIDLLSDGVTPGSSVENTITQNAVLPLLEAGKAYTVKLHLGMTSVKFDAVVSDWDNGGAVDVDLSKSETFDSQEAPLTIEPVLASATVTFNVNTDVASSPVYYSFDGGKTWEPDAYVSGTPIRLSKESDRSRVSFKGANASYASSQSDYSQITISGGDCYIYGNVMSLTNPEDYATATTLTGTYTFCNLFKGQTLINNHYSRELILPATTLTERCYNGMFYGTGLKKAPALPAGSLATYCYNEMFRNCKSLATAPELPAMSVADGSYADMFRDCTSLTAAPELLATSVATGCYYEMFWGCTSLSSVPASLPATSVAVGSYNCMFFGCTSLTTAPALPAETLAEYCYSSMFQNCTSLTTAPALPAETLATACYISMFSGCTSLTTAPELPATTLVSSCYSDMFRGCSNLNYIKAMFTTTPTPGYTSYWVFGVSPTGTFVKNSAATWTLPSMWNSWEWPPAGWTIVEE